MSTYSIAVLEPDGDPVMVPATLEITPLSWSAIATGGMWDAEIQISGALDELAGLTAWLGYRLEIHNADGMPVWWGDIQTVEIVADGLRRGISLDRMANRVQVRYALPVAGGGAVAAETEWADNELSQAKYGIWELRISPARSMTAAEATAYRANALSVLSEPRYSLSLDGGATMATLHCTGPWQRTKRRYYVQPWGLVQHVADDTAGALGLGFTSSTVAFVARTDEMHSIAGYLRNFQEGMRVTVTGASTGGHNTAWLLLGADDRAPASYTSTGITFSPADDMADANGGLAFLAANDVFTISGTNDNNGTHLLDKEGAAAIEVSGGYHGGAVVSESAGDTVVFSRGNKVRVSGSFSNEHVGNSVTVTAWGMKYYQTFTLPVTGSWTAAAIEIRLQRVGGPTDDVRVKLVLDSSGSPGTELDSATVAADDIPLDMAWVTFALDDADLLSYGTVYGIVVERTGSNHQDNYFMVGLDDAAGYAGGGHRQWDGATWRTADPDVDLVFRVLGAQDTNVQAQAVLQAQGWPGVDVVNSGIVANQYRDGETRSFDELEAFLAMGYADGSQARAFVARTLVVGIAPRPSRWTAARWVYANGALSDAFGQPAPAGFLPAGEWVNLGNAETLGPWSRLSPVYVERAEWRAGSGLVIEPEGTAETYNTGVAQG